jgi:YVTN family beta-propeller protein
MRTLLLPASLVALLAMPASAQEAPRGALLLVANKQEASLSVIDPASGGLLATVPTGVGPHEVAVTSDGRWAVVCNYGAQTPGSSLTIIDLRTLKVARTIDLG